jgi:hypothetical protein
LTESTAATDDVNVTNVTAGGIDTVVGFTAGAVADGGDTISGLFTATHIVDETATDYDTSYATLALAAAQAATESDGTTDVVVFNYGGDQYALLTANNVYAAADDALVIMNGVDVDDLVIGNFIA